MPRSCGMQMVRSYAPGENGTTIYEWADGTFTRNGKTVNDPRKDTNMSISENETVVLTLPDEVASNRRVNVGGLLFEKRGIRWQRVGGTTRYSWAELFQLDGGKVTVLPSSPAVSVVTDVLTEAGVFNATIHAAKIVDALNASTKVDLVARNYKVGDKVQVEEASKVEADENVTQVTDRDGDTWSRTQDGKWALREQVNEQSTGDLGRLALYAPLTIKTVK